MGCLSSDSEAIEYRRMKAELIDFMGSDLTCVNAARVSFDKESGWVEEHWNGFFEPTKFLSEKDQKLISYLAKHNHWTPFSHVQITMRETVPIFVARQRFKHKVGFTENEVSRRYVDDELEFWTPKEWRAKAENKKQGSSDEVVKERTVEYCGVRFGYGDILDLVEGWYNENDHICPEQRRAALPQSMYTSYYCTGSLAAWARAYNLRSEEHAQKEIQDLAEQWDDIIGGIPELKYSWRALTNKKD